MIDLDKIYEQNALKIATELQGFIGANMVMSKFDFKNGKVKGLSRNPNTGVGTLRVGTGKLYRSFTPKKTNMGNIYQMKKFGESFQFVYGSKIVYANIHEFGGVAGNGAKIPKRPYFAPAIREWKTTRLPDFKKEMQLQIIREVKKWLVSQRQLNK